MAGTNDNICRVLDIKQEFNTNLQKYYLRFVYWGVATLRELAWGMENDHLVSDMLGLRSL